MTSPMLPTRADGRVDVPVVVMMITEQNWENGGVLLMDFAAAQQLIQIALAHERERCAKEAYSWKDKGKSPDGEPWIGDIFPFSEGVRLTSEGIAAAIRKMEP